MKREHDKQTSRPLITKRDLKTVALAVDPNRWFRDEAKARGWRLVNHRLAQGLHFDGAFVNCLPDDPVVEELRMTGCHIVRMGRLPHPNDHLLPAVLPDMKAQGRIAAEHFAERGFTDIGFYGHNPWGDAQVLCESFFERAKELKMHPHLYRLERLGGERSEDYRLRNQTEFISWIKTVPKPIGLLSPSDTVATNFCVWANKVGFKVPEDIAVLGRGNKGDVCECSLPTISSIDLNHAGIVHTACELLETLMEGKSVAKDPVIVKPNGVVERESSSVLATPDTVVATALRYLWDYLDLDITVEDVAEEVGISSRQLERRFKKALNRTVNEELRRKRLDEVRRLLLSTDLPIAELSSMVNFHPTYLHRQFLNVYGMTPAQFRRQRRLNSKE